MENCVDSLDLALRQLHEHLSERAHRRCRGKRLLAGRRVLYWTHHALRVDENPALDVARHLAHHLNLPLLIYQGLSERYRFASDRHHTFILEAARELQAAYEKLGIAYEFYLDRRGHRQPRLAQLALSSAVVVTEDFPLEATKQWTDRLIDTNATAVVLVDTACVAPMRLVGKAYDRAFAFRQATSGLYRQRVDREWPECQLTVQPDAMKGETLQLGKHSLAELVAQCDIDHSVGPVSDTRGGSLAGYERWRSFRKFALRDYASRRNRIEFDGVSRMSAYLHYGMVSPLRLAREASADGAEKYLDELLVWRELAYAFCYYRNDLQSESILPSWAIATLREHANDPRNILSWECLARARSGSRLWDAAQRSLLKHGELHNNVRMTWGKALLSWSGDHQDALERLVDLNHRFALDGRDPASYGGILWCLGQFDRPFPPAQPILGTVRPRPLEQHERRTNLAAYEARVDRCVAEPLPRIAMIGTGLGGLMCSRILEDHGFS
ncbi:MAG: deoxyribodipyrimidine photo-lyase, partial [Planctomycetales bacterium]|nr:deoxyribodipyrimidine photo-lyase [Planctomycetales bacterium]